MIKTNSMKYSNTLNQCFSDNMKKMNSYYDSQQQSEKNCKLIERLLQRIERLLQRIEHFSINNKTKNVAKDGKAVYQCNMYLIMIKLMVCIQFCKKYWIKSIR